MTDLSFRYGLPYQTDAYGYHNPIAPLRLRDRFQAVTDALLDTCSALTLLDTNLTPQLGLQNVIPLRRQRVDGIGGQGGDAAIHRIWVQIFGTSERMPVWSVEVGFLPGLWQLFGTNILGRDLMTRLRLAFRQRERRLYFDVE